MNQTLTYVKYLPHVNFPMGLMLICTGTNLYPYVQILFIFFFKQNLFLFTIYLIHLLYVENKTFNSFFFHICKNPNKILYLFINK